MNNVKDQYLDAVTATIRNLDINAARELMAPGINHNTSDHEVLVAMHKARYEHTWLESALRHESAEWLRKHGYRRMFGAELLPPGYLP